MPGNMLSYTFSCLCGRLFIGTHQNCREFLATHAKHGIFLAQGFSESLAYCPEHTIANGMPVGVIE